MKKNSKKVFATATLAATLFLSACGGAVGVGGGDFPNRDINVTVPWGAGGGTDLTVRTLVYEMGAELGIQMPVSNMPGASGSVGMLDVYEGTRDGYRLLGSSMTSVTTAQVMGFAEIGFENWHAWNAAFAPSVVAVRSDSDIHTIQDLIDAMHANPGGVSVSSSGVGSSGHLGAIVFADAVGATFSHIPYDGGNAAIIAALGGEVDFTAQLSSEMIDFIRSGDMRPLASLSPGDLIITANDGSTIVVPSLATVAPDVASMLPIGGSFGIFLPSDISDDILNTINEAYQTAVASDNFRNFVEQSGMVWLGSGLAETRAYLERNASIVSWVLYDVGAAPNSPLDFGIQRP